MEKQYCKNCGKECIKHAKEMCTTCYKKLAWKPRKRICKRCGRLMMHQAKGYCPGCYNYIFHLEKTKAGQYKKYHNIDLETYKRITKSCLICGFDKVIDLYHLDENKENNSESNLIGLCPNHHKMLHDFRWRKEMMLALNEIFKSKGIPEFKDHKKYSYQDYSKT